MGLELKGTLYNNNIAVNVIYTRATPELTVFSSAKKTTTGKNIRDTDKQQSLED